MTVPSVAGLAIVVMRSVINFFAHKSPFFGRVGYAVFCTQSGKPLASIQDYDPRLFQAVLVLRLSTNGRQLS